MTTSSSTADEATAFYDAHYAVADPIFLEPGVKLMLGDMTHPRTCRFCTLQEPVVTFKDQAHALPASFGNTGLFSAYECDTCNHHFGEGIENDLGNWTKPIRTMSRIKGRSGVPTIKKAGTGQGWRVEFDGSGFHLSEYENDPVFELNQAARELNFELHRDSYVPVAVLKGLVKIGLTLLPDVEVQNFRETCEWILERDHSRNFVSEFPVYRTFVPGPMRADLITLMLFRRRQGIQNVPYAFYVLGYGNEVLQVFLPSVEQDRCIDGKELALPAFHTPSLDAERYGRPRTNVENLTGRERVKGEKVPIVVGFEGITIDNAPHVGA